MIGVPCDLRGRNVCAYFVMLFFAAQDANTFAAARAVRASEIFALALGAVGSKAPVCEDRHHNSAISAIASKRALMRASSAMRLARSAGSSAITITASKKSSTGACNCARRVNAPA